MKKTLTTTALALPTVQAIQPKPTKTEIVEAMLVRAKVKHDAENERRKKLRSEIEKSIKDAAMKALKSKDLKPSIQLRGYGKNVEIEYTVETPAIKSMFVELDGLGHLHWEEKEMRQTIREELEVRKARRLLDDPDAVKAMDAMLEEWGL